MSTIVANDASVATIAVADGNNWGIVGSNSDNAISLDISSIFARQRYNIILRNHVEHVLPYDDQGLGKPKTRIALALALALALDLGLELWLRLGLELVCLIAIVLDLELEL